MRSRAISSSSASWFASAYAAALSRSCAWACAGAGDGGACACAAATGNSISAAVRRNERSIASRVFMIVSPSKPERIAVLQRDLAERRMEVVARIERVVAKIVVEHEECLAARLRNPVQPAIHADRTADVVVLQQVDPRPARRKD